VFPSFRYLHRNYDSYLLIFYCCAGWGYIVTFTKVLTIYQICCTWIHPLNYSPLSSLPPFLEEFQQVSFFHLHTCVHSICTIFIFLLPWNYDSLPNLIYSLNIWGDFSQVGKHRSYLSISHITEPWGAHECPCWRVHRSGRSCHALKPCRHEHPCMCPLLHRCLCFSREVAHSQAFSWMASQIFSLGANSLGSPECTPTWITCKFSCAYILTNCGITGFMVNLFQNSLILTQLFNWLLSYFWIYQKLISKVLPWESLKIF
jgi:hypothetical protein